MSQISVPAVVFSSPHSDEVYVGKMISELKEGGQPHNDIIDDTREVLIDIAMEMNTVKKSDGSIVNSRRAAARLLGISAATIKSIQFKK